ncbi:MAG: UDP-N-acetylglucosamine 2-epimerase (non-hydrolyzing) [Dehalococcoidales bacterium]|nr:UDP-N-acetylglucosamine 2-epimerase (non-hydrolyzing) [Dehalococcoidales bacterium]
MKIAIILGTRPEITKMAPLIKIYQENRADYFILHTGQHYSYQMDKVFFDQLKLPQPKYNIDVGSSSHGEQTGKMLIGIEKILLKEKPDVVLVEGDTNSVLAGALAAAKLGIRVGHVESGLRSYDRAMPEELNRLLADHIADYLFAPTPKSKQILLGEGIDEKKVFVTGNTIVDSIFQNLELAKSGKDVLGELKLKPKRYFLVTLHRQENVDNAARFGSILQGLGRIAQKYKLPVVYPIHPRSRKMMDHFKLKPENLTLIEPVDFLAFLQLENGARLILTDSGGVQEEACILGVPCVTLRDNTERPETLELGSNMLAGADAERILECAEIMLDKKGKWDNPFGDGKAAARIAKIIAEAENG